MNVVNSKTDICNMALDYIGVKNITSFDEDTKAGLECRRWYDLVRKELLINLNASFSIARAVLSVDLNYKTISVDDKCYGYENAFVLPKDCLFVLNVGDMLNVTEKQIEGKYLFADFVDNCPIRYIKDVTDISSYDAGFVKLFALKLAEQICFPLTNDNERTNYIMQLAERQYIYASSKYGNDNKITVVNIPRFRNSRHNHSIVPTSNRIVR